MKRHYDENLRRLRVSIDTAAEAAVRRGLHPDEAFAAIAAQAAGALASLTDPATAAQFVDQLARDVAALPPITLRQIDLANTPAQGRA